MIGTDAIAGLVLCGGRATRMGGGDKCLLPLGASTVLGHLIARAAPQVTEMAISANGDPNRYETFRLAVVADEGPGHSGPLAGILAGMNRFSRLGAWQSMASLAGDTPFIPHELVSRLAAATPRGSDAIAVAMSRGRSHPVIALWPLSLREDLRTFLAKGEERSVRAFSSRHEVVDVAFEDADMPGGRCDPFFNINSPDDLAAASLVLEGRNA